MTALRTFQYFRTCDNLVENLKINITIVLKLIQQQKMLMKISLYFVAALIATSLFSCKKNNNSKNCSLSEANLAGTYKIGTVIYKATATSPGLDATSMVDACSLDDLQTYKSDHTLIYTDAGVKCDPPGDGTSTWSLSGKTLTAGGDGGTITSFDCSGFTVTQSDVMVAGDSFAITFQKQ